MHLPDGLRKRLRTPNGLERINHKPRRHFNVIGSFSNDARFLRPVSAVLMELGDAWQHVKTTLNRRDQTTDRPGDE